MSSNSQPGSLEMVPSITKVLTLLALFVPLVLSTDAATRELFLPSEIMKELVGWCVNRPWILSPISLTCHVAFRERVKLATSLLTDLGLPIPSEPSFEDSLATLRQAQVLNTLRLPWQEDWVHPFEYAELSRLVSPAVMDEAGLDAVVNPLDFKRLILLTFLICTPSTHLNSELMNHLLGLAKDLLAPCAECSTAGNRFCGHGTKLKTILDKIFRVLGWRSHGYSGRVHALKYLRSLIHTRPDSPTEQQPDYPAPLPRALLDEAGKAITTRDNPLFFPRGSGMGFNLFTLVTIFFVDFMHLNRPMRHPDIIPEKSDTDVKIHMILVNTVFCILGFAMARLSSQGSLHIVGYVAMCVIYWNLILMAAEFLGPWDYKTAECVMCEQSEWDFCPNAFQEVMFCRGLLNVILGFLPSF